MSIGSVFYTYSMGDARTANIDRMLSNLAAFVTESEGPVGYLFHVASGARPPSAEDRARVTASFNQHASKLTGVAVVIEASGPSSALLRSAVTMVFNLSRRSFETRTFEDVVAASEWLGPKQWMVAAELVTGTAEARAALTKGHVLLW